MRTSREQRQLRDSSAVSTGVAVLLSAVTTPVRASVQTGEPPNLAREGGRDIHETAIVGQRLRIGFRCVAREQPNVLDRLVALEVAHGGGNVAQRTEIGAGGRLAFHRDRTAGDGLDHGALISTVL